MHPTTPTTPTPPAYSLLSSLFPPSPTFLPSHLPSLRSRIYIITGSVSGIGFELARILYLSGATVYLCARSLSRCTEAITRIKTDGTDGGKDGGGKDSGKGKEGKGNGRLEALVMDVSDLKSVKAAVDEFLGKEERLDGLWHNAGVMTPPPNSVDVLGNDLELSTHCLGPYLLTTLLSPLLIKTAAKEGVEKGSVRVVWVASLLQLGTPTPAILFDSSSKPKPIVRKKPMENYIQSKAGTYFLSRYFAGLLGEKGVLSVSVHPGLTLTSLQRNWPLPARLVMRLLFKPPLHGAYSLLYAGFSPNISMVDNGGYYIAWGRKSDIPVQVKEGLKDGGMEKLVGFCEGVVGAYL